MLSKKLVVGCAPLLGSTSLGQRVSCSLAERNEPCAMISSFNLNVPSSSPTNWPSSFSDAMEDAIHFPPVRHPIPRHQRHAHCPKAPAQEWDPFQLLFREVATSAKHAAAESNVLNEIEVCPFHLCDSQLQMRKRDLVPYNDSRLRPRSLFAAAAQRQIL